ncbi:MAG: HAD family hydrolase [Coprobacillus sp.]
MNKRIIFLDVDGTLTSPQGDVSQCVKNAIKEARLNGHYVFLCTGRNKSGIRSLLDIGFDGIICSAGGYIEMDNKMLYESFLSMDDLKEAREIFGRNHVHYNLEATLQTYQDDGMNELFIGASTKEGKEMNSEMQRLMQQQKEKFNILPLDEFDKNPVEIHKICFIALNEKDLEEPIRLLSDKFIFIVHELFSKDTINGEIIIKGTNKGNAVRFIIDYLELSLDDTIGFGDSMNDLEMIKTCYYGVVMGNGSEELKKYASTICESVDDDGVYHEFKRLQLCK